MLGVSCSENAFEVLQRGMDGLSEDDRNNYVSDFKGFLSYVKAKGFQSYADQVRTIRYRTSLNMSCTLPTVHALDYIARLDGHCFSPAVRHSYAFRLLSTFQR